MAGLSVLKPTDFDGLLDATFTLDSPPGTDAAGGSTLLPPDGRPNSSNSIGYLGEVAGVLPAPAPPPRPCGVCCPPAAAPPLGGRDLNFARASLTLTASDVVVDSAEKDVDENGFDLRSFGYPERPPDAEAARNLCRRRSSALRGVMISSPTSEIEFPPLPPVKAGGSEARNRFFLGAGVLRSISGDEGGRPLLPPLGRGDLLFMVKPNYYDLLEHHWQENGEMPRTEANAWTTVPF